MEYSGRQQRAYKQFLEALRRVVQRASAELPADDVTAALLNASVRRIEVAHGAATAATVLAQLAAQARAGLPSGPAGASGRAGGQGRQ